MTKEVHATILGTPSSRPVSMPRCFWWSKCKHMVLYSVLAWPLFSIRSKKLITVTCLFEVGQFLENLQISRILHRVSIGFPMETLCKIRKIYRFSKNCPTSKTKINISPRKIIFFALDFFYRQCMVMGIRFLTLRTSIFDTVRNGRG